jgi:hypothetical protein
MTEYEAYAIQPPNAPVPMNDEQMAWACIAACAVRGADLRGPMECERMTNVV